MSGEEDVQVVRSRSNTARIAGGIGDAAVVFQANTLSWESAIVSRRAKEDVLPSRTRLGAVWVFSADGADLLLELTRVKGAIFCGDFC